MLILLTIFLFVFTSLAMLMFHLARPKLSIQGFLVVLTVLAGLPMVFLARPEIPNIITLLQWKPEILFPISPSLLIDNYSWYFALALSTLSFTVVITSIAQLGQTSKLDHFTTHNKDQLVENPNITIKGSSSEKPDTFINIALISNWQLWVAILILTCLGLLAVTAGNMLTLLLAWAALDIFELIVLLGHVLESKIRERVILSFSARMAGVITLLFACLILWSQGGSLYFEAISQSISVYLLLAAGLRLGVLPLQLPFTQGLPIRRGLGTVLRLVPAASSYILLVRMSSLGVPRSITPYLLALLCLAGLFAAVNWMGAKDELNGRPYWLLGTASLAVAAAILKNPPACLAWSITSLLSGCLIFSMSIRHRILIPLAILGAINLSTLPFSPTWQGAMLFQYKSTSPINLTLFSIFSFFLLLIQSFLVAGFIRHAVRGFFPTRVEIHEHIEQWVWLLYPFALILLVVIHLFIGGKSYPNLNGLPLYGWIIGPITLIIACLILYLTWRYPQPSPLYNLAKTTSFWKNLFSLVWIYRLLWRLFRTVSKLFSLFSTILEGEGGILWALVLFALIFVFLQR
jgi:hypothetical protein